jgi:hypothetical protein
MTMAQAIAFSAGNKAQAYTDQGKTVVVQARYSSIAQTWLHVWLVSAKEVWETDIPSHLSGKVKTVYGVDPDADYWSVAK